MLTEKQMKIRLGKVCASSISKIMGPKGFGKQGESYLWQIIAEKETGLNTEIPTTKAMEWGNDHEDEAGAYYSQCKGIELEGGESISLGELVATPDFVGEDYGVEVKCPYTSSKQAQRLRYKDYKDVKKHNPDYYWQMVAGMLATGFKKWVFLSYDPRFKDPEKKMVAIHIPLIKEDKQLLIDKLKMVDEFYKKNGVQK